MMWASFDSAFRYKTYPYASDIRARILHKIHRFTDRYIKNGKSAVYIQISNRKDVDNIVSDR